MATAVYERKEIYPLGEVFAHVPPMGSNPSKNPMAVFDGDQIRMRSQRYQLFRKSCVCVTCGLRGTYFAKERFATNRQSERYHFNLYGTREDGTEVMLTKDHIIPKSKGGKDIVSNYQTMCAPCNEKKGATVEVEIDPRILRTVAHAIRTSPNVWRKEEDGVVMFCRYGFESAGEPREVVLETYFSEAISEQELDDLHLKCINTVRAKQAIRAYHKALEKYPDEP